jgi:hypothetical protein
MTGEMALTSPPVALNAKQAGSGFGPSGLAEIAGFSGQKGGPEPLQIEPELSIPVARLKSERNTSGLRS